MSETLPRNYTPPPDLLAGRVILVTGAGQGLGRAVALASARARATVVLLGPKQANLEAVYDEIGAAHYVTGGLGYITPRVGIDLGARKQVGGDGDELMVQLGLRMFLPN